MPYVTRLWQLLRHAQSEKIRGEGKNSKHLTSSRNNGSIRVQFSNISVSRINQNTPCIENNQLKAPKTIELLYKKIFFSEFSFESLQFCVSWTGIAEQWTHCDLCWRVCHSFKKSPIKHIVRHKVLFV